MLIVLLISAIFLITSYSYYNILKKPREKIYILLGIIPSLAIIGIYITIALTIPVSILLLFLFSVLYSIFSVIIIKIKLGKMKVKEIYQLSHDNTTYKVKVYDSNIPNAWANIISAEISMTTILMKILEKEELKAVMFHEIGHINNKVLKILSVITTFLWNMLMPFTVLILGYLINKIFLLEIDATELLVSVFMLLVAYSLTTIITFVDWTYEHKADMYAATKTSPQIYGKTLIKVVACSRLKELCTRKLIENVPIIRIDKITWKDVLKEFLYLIFKMPMGFIDMFKNNPYPTHPPLHFRLYAIQRINTVVNDKHEVNSDK